MIAAAQARRKAREADDERLSPAAREYVLAFADDEHMIGARHTNWIGLGPFLEEDLAFCSIAQDELGHAIAPLSARRRGDDRRRRVALGRSAAEYRSLVARRMAVRRLGVGARPALALRPRRGAALGRRGRLVGGGARRARPPARGARRRSTSPRRAAARPGARRRPARHRRGRRRDVRASPARRHRSGSLRSTRTAALAEGWRRGRSPNSRSSGTRARRRSRALGRRPPPTRAGRRSTFRPTGRAERALRRVPRRV